MPAGDGPPGMSATDALDLAIQKLASTRTQQLQLWDTTLPEAVQSAGLAADHAPELAELIMQTLPEHHDQACQQAVQGVVRLALRHEAFVKAFAAALVRQSALPMSRQEAYVLLCWNLLTVQQLQLPGGQKAVAKLIECQAPCLQRLDDRRIRWGSVHRATARLLRGRPELVTLYAAGAASTGSPGLLWVLLEALSSNEQGRSQLQELKPRLMSLFCDNILSARQAPLVASVQAYRRLLASLTEQEVAGSIMPALLRMLRKAPDAVLPSAAIMLRWVRLSADSRQELCSELLKQARSSKEPIRESAVACMAALESRAAGTTALGQLVAAVRSQLDGSAGARPRSVHERAGLVAALGALVPSREAAGGAAQAGVKRVQPDGTDGVDEELQSLAEQACSFLADLGKEEANEEVKISTIVVMGQWLSLAGSLPDAVAKRLVTSLAEKDAVKRAALKALAQALQANPGLRRSGQLLAAPLAKVIQDGVAKATLRADAVPALLAAAMFAASMPDVDASFESRKVWASAVQAGSPLLSPVTLSKLPAAEAQQAPMLCELLLLRLQHRLDDAGVAAVSCLLVSALLHWSAAVRRAAAQTATRCILGQQALAGVFVDSLLAWQEALPELPVAIDPAAQEDNLPATQPALAGRLVDAAVTLAAGLQQGVSGEVLGKLMLLTHHASIVAYRQNPRAGWQPVRRKLRHADASIAAAAKELTAMFLGNQGSYSAQPLRRHAADLALATAMFEATYEMFPHVIAGLRERIDHAKHASVTAHQIKIFFTPPGVIALQPDIAKVGLPKETAPVANGIAKAPAKMAAPRRTVSVSTSQASSGGGRPAAGTGKPAARNSKTVKDPIAEAKEAQLMHEAEERAHVQAVKDCLDSGLQALAAVASGNPAFTADQMDALKPLVMPLLASPLVGEGSAFDAVLALARCLPRGLARQATAIASTLRLVELSRMLGSDVTPQAIIQRQPLADTVQALAAAVADRQPLPGPSYGLCFPALAAVLSVPEHTPLHDEALAVIALHVAPGKPLPRRETLALLYNVLEVMPAYRERVEDLLTDVCQGISAGELPAALQGLLAASPHVRMAALSALIFVPCLAQGDLPADDAQVALLWLGCHDPIEENAEAGRDVWDLAQAQLPYTYATYLVPFLGHEHLDVRLAAAGALAAGMQEHPGTVSPALQLITSQYNSMTVQRRSGAALALKSAAAHLLGTDLSATLHFLLDQGLGDAAVMPGGSTVSDDMVQAGVAIVNVHGAAEFASMMGMFEGCLDKQVHDDAGYDKVREGAVILLGTLARHISPADPKVKSIITALEEALPTPSRAVQDTVSGCLVPLMEGLQQNHEAFLQGFLERLLTTLVTHDNYAQRRGAAWGIAGAVKGLGIEALKRYSILDAIMTALNDEKSAKARDGALSAVECLQLKLGRLFEPYVKYVIPRLLVLMGDSSADVRQSAVITAREIMAALTSHGVKLVLPAILKGITDRAWRSKQGSIQLLGATAHCAPQQLSVSLPKAVPILTEALADPHPKVQEAAKKALEEIGSVIRNPEVQRMAKSLLAAIANPSKHARPALDILLQTVFVHSVDAPSLALMVPVVQRGLGDRSGDAKKRAARIVGNMCTLINDPQDMAPYVAKLMPKLKDALVDPLPEVRATSAKALGSLLRGMGEEYLQDILPYLLEKLKSEGSSVERSGAAQGLAEVLAVLGPSKLELLLPEILNNTKSRSPYVREGHLTLFKFLPLVIPDLFQEHLHDVLPSILDGLADEAEGVRDAALASGRTFVELYAQTALPLLLPAVEDGIGHENWRIRQSSVELLGDLLFKVAGTSGKIQTSGNTDEEGVSIELHGAAIIDALGMARRNEVLSRIFMARSDLAYSVRTAALHVWKTIVTNTPRTTGEILTTLMDQIIKALGQPSEERQQAAARCLGELVHKMGDRVLHQIIPILREGMQAEDPSRRQGVCIGLAEVLDNITRSQLQENLAALLPAVQAALCDPDAGVRQAAGAAVSILFKGGTGGAVDSVIPSLLQSLDGSPQQSAQALEGLRVILTVRPQTLGTMVPRLLRPPNTSTSMRALGALAEVAGAAMHAHLSHIMPVLLRNAGLPEASTPAVAAAREASQKVAASVTEDGVYLLMSEFHKALEDGNTRMAAAAAIAHYCRNSKVKFEEHWETLLEDLVPLMAENDHDTLLVCWDALAALTGIIPKEIQASYVRTLKEGIDTAKELQRRKRRPGPIRVAGFCEPPKALGPVVPILLQGLLQTSLADIRRQSAEALGELVEITSEEALKPFVVMITGPLIRIVGDRFAADVKEAVLTTLGLLIGKAGANLKPFVPQLQTSFSKCLADQSRTVRQTAASNLGQLVRMSPRVDQVATDLVTSAQQADLAIKESYLTALMGLLMSSGDRVKPEIIVTTGKALQAMQSAPGGDEPLQGSVARCLGMYARYAGQGEAAALLQSGPLSPAQSSDWLHRLGQALTLAAVAQYAPARIEQTGLTAQCARTCTHLLREEREAIKLAAGRAAAYLVIAELQGNLPEGSALQALIPVIVALIGQDQASEVQRQGLQILRKICTIDAAALELHHRDLVPSICSLLQDTAGPTKLAAERTLARVLQADMGLDVAHAFLASGSAGGMVKGYLNDAYLRRLNRLPLDEADSDEL